MTDTTLPVESLNQTKKAENDDILAKAEEEANKAAAGEGESQETTTPAETPVTPEGGETPDPNGEQTPAETTTPSDTETDPEDLSHISARGQERIKKLADEAAKVPDLQHKVEVLEKLVNRTRSAASGARVPGQPGNGEGGKQSGGKLPWDQTATQTLPDGESTELTIDEVKEEVRKTTREEIENENIVNAMETDAILMEEKHPEFRKPTDDKPNPAFDQDLVNFVMGIFQNEVKQNKKTRLSDVVERVMSIRRRGAEEERKRKTEIVSRQAAEQAIDPSGTTPLSPSGNDNLEGKIRGAKSMKDLEKLEKLISAE